MSNNSMAIIILCSHLCKNEKVVPYEPVEWTKLADKLIDLNLTPEQLITFDENELFKYFEEEEVDRILHLVERSASITFEISKYEKLGIKIVTRADSDYPKSLKNKLKKSCPPLFYYVGDLKICNKKSIGFVGSRNIIEEDIEFTKKLTLKAISKGYAIVSGGAKGVDSVSVEEALNNNGLAIEYIADSMLKKIKEKHIIEAVKNNRLVILSSTKPDTAFNVGFAMNRNKYIYSQSIATIIVKSDYNKGGTWAGAIESLNKDYSVVLCNDNNSMGNAAIIKKGAFPIDYNWDGKIPNKKYKPIQLSIF